MTRLSDLKPDTKDFDGTLISASLEVNQLFHFNGRISNLAMVIAETHSWLDKIRDAYHVPVFCLAEHSSDTIKNTAQLLTHPLTLDFLKQLPSPLAILMFKPDARTVAALKKIGIQVIGTPPQLARRLENKLLFPELAAEAGIPIPESQTVTLNPLDPVVPFEKPWVCQFAKGFSGNRTFLIQWEKDWSQLVEQFNGRKCRITRHLSGDTWTANGCVLSDGKIITTHPFLQETRLLHDRHNVLPLRIGSRGNRWYSDSQPFDNILRNHMHSMGSVLHQRGYHGFFGLDFLIHEKTVYAIEINPRLTASACVLTPLEMIANDSSLLFHYLSSEISFSKSTHSCTDCSELQPLPWTGGQFIVRNKDQIEFKDPSIAPGIYKIISGQLIFSRDGFSPAELDTDETLIWRPDMTSSSHEAMRLIYRGQHELCLEAVSSLFK